MANIISGQIICINQTQPIPSKKGGDTFYKREFAIKALRYDQNDGSASLNEYNTPMLEVQGFENCKGLDAFKVGEFVKVKFVLEGRSYANADGNTKYFTTARALSLEQINVDLKASENNGNLPF